MKEIVIIALGFSMGVQAGGPVCTPGAGTAFTEYENKAFTISNDVPGVNSLFSQCSNMSDQQLITDLIDCGMLTHPINGLGMNPADKLLYGLMPTDTMGIGTHLEIQIPFPAPGEPGDMMKADPVDVYRIGNDGGYQRIGSIDPPAEDAVLPPDDEQVIPLIHTASTFDQNGNMFVLGYKTNYDSSADIMAGTAEVLYKAPKIMIGQVTNGALAAAAGGTIPATWFEADSTTDATCAALMNGFAARTNAFSQCVVADFLSTGDADGAVQSCLTNTSMLDFGVHDFAVSPVNNNFYAFDSMTLDGVDVLIEVDAVTKQASCTNFPDAGNNTGVLTSLMFSQQNKLVAIFANETIGRWINVNTGVITSLSDIITPYPFGDGSSLPFAAPFMANSPSGINDLIFKNGFDDLIFKNGFGDFIIPPGCPAF